MRERVPISQIDSMMGIMAVNHAALSDTVLKNTTASITSLDNLKNAAIAMGQKLIDVWESSSNAAKKAADDIEHAGNKAAKATEKHSETLNKAKHHLKGYHPSKLVPEIAGFAVENLPEIAGWGLVLHTMEALSKQTSDLLRDFGGDTNRLTGFTNTITGLQTQTHLASEQLIELGKAFKEEGLDLNPMVAPHLKEYVAMSGEAMRMFDLSAEQAAKWTNSMRESGSSVGEIRSSWESLYKTMQEAGLSIQDMNSAIGQSNALFETFGAVSGKSVFEINTEIAKTGGLLRSLGLDAKQAGAIIGGELANVDQRLLHAGVLTSMGYGSGAHAFRAMGTAEGHEMEQAAALKMFTSSSSLSMMNPDKLNDDQYQQLVVQNAAAMNLVMQTTNVSQQEMTKLLAGYRDAKAHGFKGNADEWLAEEHKKQSPARSWTEGLEAYNHSFGQLGETIEHVFTDLAMIVGGPLMKVLNPLISALEKVLDGVVNIVNPVLQLMDEKIPLLGVSMDTLIGKAAEIIVPLGLAAGAISLLGPAFTYLTGVAGALGALISATGLLVAESGGVLAAAFGALGTTLEGTWLGSLLPALATELLGLEGIMTLGFTEIGGAVATFSGVMMTGLIGLLTPLAAMALPITLTVAGLVALGAVIWTFRDQIGHALMGAGEWLKESFTKALKQPFDILIKSLSGMIDVVKNMFGKFIANPFAEVAPLGLVNLFAPIFQSLFHSFGDFLREIFDNLVHQFKTLLGVKDETKDVHETGKSGAPWDGSESGHFHIVHNKIPGTTTVSELTPGEAAASVYGGSNAIRTIAPEGMLSVPPGAPMSSAAYVRHVDSISHAEIAPQTPATFGWLSGKYESGRAGVIGDHGNAFGAWQFDKRFHVPQHFVNSLKNTHPEIYNRLHPLEGTIFQDHGGMFGREWRKIGADSPEVFKDLQRDYAKRMYLDPLLHKFGHALDNKVLQEVAFSTSIHHGAGGAAQILKHAGLGKNSDTSELIHNIYQGRDAATKGAFHSRYTRESHDALIAALQESSALLREVRDNQQRGMNQQEAQHKDNKRTALITSGAHNPGRDFISNKMSAGLI